MGSELKLLQVEGSRIVNGRGETVRLRGLCLGGWMNMENFILGYPGHESGLRRSVAGALDKDKADFFIARFLDYFVTEADLRFLKDLGCNVIRIPLNYRHFEADDSPFEYRPEGFTLLDRVIGWARRLDLYVILDLHAVQGWQNRGWHCDNPCRSPHFFGQKVFEDRAVALWQELARRYRGEPIVAGYNVMNEPDADEMAWLNRFYRRVTEAIRGIDPDHILFLEGNRYSQQFDELDPPFDRNTVYSSHNYAEPALENVPYPGDIGGVFYDRARLEIEYRTRAQFMRRHGVPNWVGEFGAIFYEEEQDAFRLKVLEDQIRIIEGQGHHWTLWTYKDIGKMGLVTVDKESEWMRRTRPVREAKSELRTDYWIERPAREIDRRIGQVRAHVEGATAGLAIDRARLDAELSGAVCESALSQILLPAFAEQFREMSENEIDRMMQSFLFQNCLPREDMVDLLRRCLSGK